MIIAAALLAALLMFSGAGIYLFSSGKDAGRAACVADLKEADDKLKARADQIAADSANKIIDMAAAYEAGEANAKTRTVYVQTKGKADVAKYPVFTNAQCVLPAESLGNLNAARAGMRSEPERMRDAANDKSPGARPPANPSPTVGTMREPGPVANRNHGGAIPGDADGRRPLGKVSPRP